MEQFQKKDVVQAVLLTDLRPEAFKPICDNSSTALLTLANVPLLDYALESLNRSGIEEVFVYARLHMNDIKEHISKRQKQGCTWSINMSVKVIGAEGCRCLGDALRDIDAKSLIRGHFVLMEAETVTNANLSYFLEEHKKTAKYDKGIAMTVIYKEVITGVRTGDEVMIAMSTDNKRLQYHQRIKTNFREQSFAMPLDIFLQNSNVALHHNLADPQIAICSPLLLTLFSDNFDFENRDDFVRGLIINEEVLNSRIYVEMLPREQYARRVSNWLTYQIVSNDVINRWSYPLVPDMGICCLRQQFLFLRNNIYKHESATLSKLMSKENIVLDSGSSVDTGSKLSSVVIGRNCKIGKNCNLDHVYMFDDVVIEDNCSLEYCLIGSGAKISSNSHVLEGVVIAPKTVIAPNSNITTPSETDPIAKRFSISTQKTNDTEELDDEEDEEWEVGGFLKMRSVPFSFEDSEYNSSTEDELSSHGSPVPDDTNIFLSEVIDSLTRGYNEKSNPDFLILEINSSRYAYNMSLSEVNFYVTKAILSLPKVKESSANIVQNLHHVLGHLGPVISNYIKYKDAMIDCLKGVEDCCNQEEEFKAKVAQIVHYLYDKDYVAEDAILEWYENLSDESEWMKTHLKKLIDWLMASSEEESEEE